MKKVSGTIYDIHGNIIDVEQIVGFSKFYSPEGYTFYYFDIYLIGGSKMPIRNNDVEEARKEKKAILKKWLEIKKAKGQRELNKYWLQDETFWLKIIDIRDAYIVEVPFEDEETGEVRIERITFKQNPKPTGMYCMVNDLDCMRDLLYQVLDYFCCNNKDGEGNYLEIIKKPQDLD